MGTAILFAFRKILSKLLMTLIGEKMLEWALFKIAEQIVASTATKHDDEWFNKIKEEYEKINKE